MKNLILYCSCVFLIYSNEINGQNLIQIAEKFSSQKFGSGTRLNDFRAPGCDPDSIIFYGFISPEDSVVGIRRIFRKYGGISTAIYEYEFVDDTGILKLGSVDSTVYDNAGRPILNEIWEYDFDSTALLLKERTIFHPHEGNVIKDYSFLEHMLNELNFFEGDFVDFDSAIVYRPEFSTGIMLPYNKKVHSYSQEGRLHIVQNYNYFEFNMSWSPSTHREVFYSTSGRIEKIEESSWNGNAFTLVSTSLYSYDSRDSLVTILLTNNLTGLLQEKLDMSYDNLHNATTAVASTWDETTNDWTEVLRMLGDFDNQSRLSILELEFNFFGDSETSQYVYKYNGDASCPHYIDVYYFEEGEWVFGSRIYFYPSTTTSVHDAAIPGWKVYPNPASEGVWIEAPIGSEVQIASIQGKIICKGIINNEKEYFRLDQVNTQLILTIKNESSISSRIISVNK